MITSDDAVSADAPLIPSVTTQQDDQTTSRKRKWTALDNSRAHASLTKLCIIARAQLPLSFLEPTHIQSKRFHARIAELEDDPSYDGARLLVTRDEGSRLSVIERVRDSEYGLCRLAGHVTLEMIKALPPPRSSAVIAAASRPDEPWWQPAMLPRTITVDNVSVPRKAPRLTMLRHLTDGELCSEERHKIGTPAQGDSATAIPPPPPGDDTQVEHEFASKLSTDEVVANFIASYLDILYKTRTSVAYFAKAHVARMKAQMTASNAEGNATIIDILHGLVLTSSTADNKYKTVWPALLKDHVPNTTTVDENLVGSTKPKQTRKRKLKLKLKADKKGLLHEEELFFLGWWTNVDDSSGSGDSIDSRFKRRSTALRTREVFLQIVLILEIAALRTTTTEMVTKDEAIAPKKVSKDRDRSDVANLDLLLDKLCIWHSLDTITAVNPSIVESTQEAHAPDQLRSFCVEVVLPFYMAKLPKLAGRVNKKLGGPSIPSKSKDDRKQEGDTKKKRQPLQKLPSERQSKGHKPVPALARASTDSQLLSEGRRSRSETPLEGYQGNAATALQVRKSKALDQMKMQKREVDFDAMSQAHMAKRKKQAEVDAKLREAISALKRPNRHLAGKELADVAEQRELMAQAREKAAATRSQKGKHKSQVQVDVTPTHNRLRRDLMTAPMVSPDAKRQAHSQQSQMVPSFWNVGSGNGDVPQTGHRQRFMTVDATPVRSSTSMFAVPRVPDSVLRQPLSSAAHYSAIAETPRKADNASGRSSDDMAVGDADSLGTLIFATPIKSVARRDEIAETPEMPSRSRSVGVDGREHRGDQAPESHAVDIYAALGWND